MQLLGCVFTFRMALWKGKGAPHIPRFRLASTDRGLARLGSSPVDSRPLKLITIFLTNAERRIVVVGLGGAMDDYPRRRVTGQRLSSAWCAFVLMTPFVLLTPAPATSVTLDFDAPEFAAGTAVQTLGDITFLHGAKVFQPVNVATFSGSQALTVATPCADATCSNGGYRMEIRFGAALPGTNGGWLWRRADSVSMRVGADSIVTGCFPEGTSCAMYAYLIGLDNNGAIVARSDDVFLFDAGSPTGLSANIDKEIRVDDAAGRIVRVILVYGKDTFSHDPGIAYPGEPQIDHLVVSFPDNPPPPPQAQPSPTVHITAPANGAALYSPYHVQLEGSVTTSGKPAAFCYGLNTPAPSLAPNCRNGQSLKLDNTFDIAIDDAQLNAGANTLSVTVFDVWGQHATQSVSLNANAPQAPRVTIWQPTDFQWLSASSASYITGSVYTVGTLQGFCIVVNATSVPTLPNCQQNLAAIPYYGFEPLNYGLLLQQGQFGAGANKISVFAYDRWGQMGSAEVSVNLPTDFRIVAMEITQAIQKMELPLNTNGTAQYAGVRLRSGVPTVVRVFANSPFAGAYCCATMLLNGFIPDPNTGEKALGTLLPDSTPQVLSSGNIDVPTAVRADPGGGYVFTLPKNWTMQNGLRLQAVLQPQLPLQECATCGGNNIFSVFGINFEQPIILTISPVELTFTNSAGTMVRPPSPTVVFAPVVNISPLPSSSVTVRPYVTTIDVSDLVNSAGGCRAVNTTCEDAVFGRVAAVDISNQPGIKIGVGPIDVGLEKLTPYFRFPDIVFEPMAVADTRSLLTAAGHEFYHELNYFHASPGCPPVNFFNLWPPDQLGYIHGVGLDRRKIRDSSGYWNGKYNVLVPGTPGPAGNATQYFDLMSYCASSDSVAWISVENWNNFGGAFPNGLIPDSIFVGTATATISQGAHGRSEEARKADGGSLRLTAVVNKKGGVGNFRVDHAEGWVLAHPAKSNYIFVVRDAKKEVLARVPALVLPPRGHASAGTTLMAHVPAKAAASIEIEHDGGVIGEVKRSPSPPVVKVTAPVEGASVSREGSLEVMWNAKDADRDKLETRIEYSTGSDKPFQLLFVGPNRGKWSVPGYLLGASAAGRLRIVASDGFNETEALVEKIKVGVAAPLLDILAPQADTVYPETTPILLQAAGFGDQAMPLPPDQMEWSVDGERVGNGAELEIGKLKVGRHVAKVTAHDGKLATTREVGFAIGRKKTDGNPAKPATDDEKRR